MLKMLILPRQARDTHRESTQKSVPCSCNRICWPIRRQRWRFLNLASPLLSSIRMHRGLVRKTHMWLLRHFYTKKIILPRQARDEHRENIVLKKERFVFLHRGAGGSSPLSYARHGSTTCARLGRVGLLAASLTLGQPHGLWTPPYLPPRQEKLW